MTLKDGCCTFMLHAFERKIIQTVIKEFGICSGKRKDPYFDESREIERKSERLFGNSDIMLMDCIRPKATKLIK
jgi:hypothetical protein